MKSTLIAAVFNNSFRGSREGNGWRVSSVIRDIATVHHIRADAFACVTDGATAADGSGFCTHSIFLRSGELNVEQHGHRRRLLAGDIFVACAWHHMALSGSGEVDILILTLPGWWSMQRFMDNFQLLPELYISKDYFAAPIITGLAQQIPDMADDQLLSQALTMLGDLLRTALAAASRPQAAMPRARGRMGEILWFIARNIEQTGMSAQDAAAKLKCSVRTIYNTCAAHGTSFSAVLIETRLVAAQYQLLQSEERISQIAYDVGFSSLSHFSRLFRARFGMTAKTMRANNQSNTGAVAPR